MTETEKDRFKSAVSALNTAYEKQRSSGSNDRIKWPSKLRIRDVEGAPGIWEVTWSFHGPDGRATFEYIDIDGDLAIRWRRIGRHDIFKSP